MIVIALFGVGYAFFNVKVTPPIEEEISKPKPKSTVLDYPIPRVKWWQSYIVDGSKMTNSQRSQHMAKFIPVYEQKMLKLRRVVAKNYITNDRQLTELMNGIQFHLQSSMDVHKALKFTCKVDRGVVKAQLDQVQRINNNVFSAIKGKGIQIKSSSH